MNVNTDSCDTLGRAAFLLSSKLRLVFVAYGQLAWPFLLTVDIRFGLFCLRFKIGLVFFALVFLLTVTPRPEIRFGLFCLRFPHRK